MPLDLKDLKTMHDKAYNSGDVTRERASDDLVFYHITQWDDDTAGSQLAYRGEFNMLKKAGRQVLADLASNPVQVDFQPRGSITERQAVADILDGLYRTDDMDNASIEAYECAKKEAVVCGVGAWLLYTEYESIRGDSRNQVIKRRPIYEANNTVFWDPNSKLMDRSDANYVSILVPYSEDGYKDLVKEMTGEEDHEVVESNFAHPEESYTFPWIASGTKMIYVAEFYHREIVKTSTVSLVDPMGQSTKVREADLAEVMDELLDAGYSIESAKTINEWQVTKYIASGEKILGSQVISGENIPVVPCYGDYAVVEGEVHYEGITRLAKDPSRLRNFILSYLADMASRSPREKPIYFPEQIAGFEDMYDETGIDNNYPYLYANRKTANGEELPVGPVMTLPAPAIPQALAALIDVTRQAVEDVANPGTPQDIADPDISGKAVLALQARLDMQSMEYQMHFKHAKRRDAEIYASIAGRIYDSPRSVRLTMVDGTTKDEQLMKDVVDSETGDTIIINDLTQDEFVVTSKIGPDYKSQREQTVERLTEQLQITDPSDPLFKALQLKIIILMDGVEFDDIRDYANMQLVIMGFRDPETDEEKAALEQAQQGSSEPSADMVLAMAEDKKGEAALLEQQIAGIKLQADLELKNKELAVKAFGAQTDRLEAEVSAEKVGADVALKTVQAFGAKVDAQVKMAGQMSRLRGGVNVSDRS